MNPLSDELTTKLVSSVTDYLHAQIIPNSMNEKYKKILWYVVIGSGLAFIAGIYFLSKNKKQSSPKYQASVPDEEIELEPMPDTDGTSEV